MRRTRSIGWVLATVVMLLGGITARTWGDDGTPSPTSAFDGMWRVTVTPNDAAERDGAQAFNDTLVFASGQFSVENFGMYGFAPAEVTLDAEHPSAFAALAQSSDYGDAHWTGQVSGGRMTGQLSWTRADGTVCVYTFTGERAR